MKVRGYNSERSDFIRMSQAMLSKTPRPNGPLDKLSLCTQFIGRASQVELLDQELNQVRDQAQIVIIGGEAGIGKTRLVSEGKLSHTSEHLPSCKEIVLNLTGACHMRRWLTFCGIICPRNRARRPKRFHPTSFPSYQSSLPKLTGRFHYPSPSSTREDCSKLFSCS